MDEKELQAPETWDLKNAETKPGVQRSRAVVSIAFNRDLFERVGEAAEASGMKLSEFIRATVSEALDRSRIPVVPLWATAAETNARSSIVPAKEEDTTTAISTASPT